MTHYSVEPRTKNMSEVMDFYHLREIYLTNVENNSWILLPEQG